MPDARLIDVAVPVDPMGVVLVLHGGANRGRAPRVSPVQPSVLRMIPVASRIARAARGWLVVLRLLNSRRGWDSEHTPLADVDWALGEAARRFGPELPVCLVGHSLGGRAALLAAGRPSVRGVVALAPWVYATDVPAAVHDTPVVIIQGDGDRIANPAFSEQVARAIGRQTPVAYVSVRGGSHSMLRRREAFAGLAARCVVWMLLREKDDLADADSHAGAGADAVLARIAAGERFIEV